MKSEKKLNNQNNAENAAVYLFYTFNSFLENSTKIWHKSIYLKKWRFLSSC